MRTLSNRPLLLLPLIPIALAVPVTLQPDNQQYPEIWVTDRNTLNATTWSTAGHNATVISSSSIQTTTKKRIVSYSATNLRYRDDDPPFAVSVSSTDSRIAYEAIDVNSSPDDRSSSGNNSISNDDTDLDNDNFPDDNSAQDGDSTSDSNGTPDDNSITTIAPYTNMTDTTSEPYTNTTDPTNSTILATGALNTTGTANLTTPLLEGNSWNLSLAVDKVNAYVARTGVLSLQLVNNLPSINVKAYVTGLDPSGMLVMLGQDGRWVYPTTLSPVPVPIPAGITIPLAGPGTTLSITLPGFISSGRIWISDGPLQFYVVATPGGPGLVEPAVANINDPNAAVNYGFAELTWDATYGLFADISAVDFVGLPLGIQVTDYSNNVELILGPPAGAVLDLCYLLTAQSGIDGEPWNELCARDTSGNIVRVLSPNTYLASNPHAFGTYFGPYVDEVWSHYTNNDLIINTQNGAGNVTCRVVGELLTCAGDNRGYAKPSNYDIFGCNTGPFAVLEGDNAIHYAVVPRLCAAFNRATLLLDGGNVTPSLPPSMYYMPTNKSTPYNHYSAFVHQWEAGGRGYAFSYDDVAPSPEEDQSGLVTSANPSVLRIIVGGT